jgi:hypothetical protein
MDLLSRFSSRADKRPPSSLGDFIATPTKQRPETHVKL